MVPFCLKVNVYSKIDKNEKFTFTNSGIIEIHFVALIRKNVQLLNKKYLVIGHARTIFFNVGVKT